MDRIVRFCHPDISSTSPVFTVLKWIGLFVGCMAKFVTGSLFVFNVYQDDLKATFNYTQKEVELQSSLMNIGLGFGILPGLFYDRFGPTWASSLGVVISVAAYMLLWSTAKYISFYSKNSWLMALYFFLGGFGSVFTYMVALNTNVINFDPKHRSKIVGILNAFLAGSPSVFAVIFYQVIQSDSSSKSFGDIMLLFAVCFGVVNLTCMLFLRLYTPLRRTQSTEYLPGNDANVNSNELNDLNDSQRKECCADQSETKLDEHLPMRKLLTNVNYLLLVGMFTFASSCGLVYLNNLTVMSKSTGQSSYDQNLVLITPITNAIVSFGVGVLSDVLKDRIPRVFLIVVACVVFTASGVFAMIWADRYGILCFATVLSGTGVGMLWTLCPAVVSEMLYIGDIGRNWGIALLTAAFLGWGIQEAFGSIYDHEAPPGDIYCTTGMNCIRGGLALLVAAGGISVVFAMILLLKRNLRNCCRS